MRQKGLVTLLLLTAGGIATAAISAHAPRQSAHPELVRAAQEFVASLDPDQRTRATFAFDDAQRFDWHFVPRQRRGLPLGRMSPQQQELARDILRAALSERGYLTASTIIELEQVLREMGGDPAVRNPELYYFSVFGVPSAAAAWGLRVEGHHLSLNLTLVNDSLISPTPAFFGASPAEVRGGSRRGLRALGSEEDVGRELVHSLNSRQLETALIARTAPRDIITGNAARVEPLAPVGIRASELRSDQVAILIRLLDVYIGRMAEPIAAQRRAAIGRAGYRDVAFAWAGSTRRGEPHYYRIQGPTFLIEYDNTQDGANHVHTVWRDFDGDFGRDLLREHYRDAPHSH